MRVFGFSWVPEHLPKALPTSVAFERIAETSGKIARHHLAAATQIDDWWAGVLLKIRDSKSVTKLRDEGGVLTVTAEKLAEGEQLAEPNFFLAHKSNGHGLYCHHYLSSSLIGDFGDFCSRQFAWKVKAKQVELIAGRDLKPFDKKILLKPVTGRLLIEQVLKPGTFDNHIRALKKIKSLEANLVSFEMKESLFNPLTKSARRKKLVLGYDDNALTGQIAAGIVECHKRGFFERARVEGTDAQGNLQVFRTNNDSHIFDEWEYDTMVETLTVRFNDLAGSIRNSDITKKLLDVANSPAVRKMLGIG